VVYLGPQVDDPLSPCVVQSLDIGNPAMGGRRWIRSSRVRVRVDAHCADNRSTTSTPSQAGGEADLALPHRGNAGLNTRRRGILFFRSACSFSVILLQYSSKRP